MPIFDDKIALDEEDAVPNLTHSFNALDHYLASIQGTKEKKFMKCIKLFTVSDQLNIIFKNQVVEAECTHRTMLYKQAFYKLENFVEASAIEKLRFYCTQ